MGEREWDNENAKYMKNKEQTKNWTMQEKKQRKTLFLLHSSFRDLFFLFADLNKTENNFAL